MFKRYTRRLAPTLLAACLLALLPAISSGGAALASTGSSTQTVSVTVVGALTISTVQTSIAFGSQTANGTYTAGIGEIDFTNTLNDNAGWSVSLAVTDLLTNPYGWADCSPTKYAQFQQACLPFANGGEALTGNGAMKPSGLTSACTSTPINFTGTDSDGKTPTLFSNAVSLVSGSGTIPASQQGSFAESGCVLQLNIPIGAYSAAYSGTAQYTITG
jgi:hypothetical protein